VHRRTVRQALESAVPPARAKATRNPAVVAHLPDGYYLARLDDMPVRMVDADVAVTGTDGTRVVDRYRLITTLTDHRAFPAAALVRLYTSGGRSSPRSSRCGPRCWLAGCCAQATGPASSRNCGRC
jgi:hypothetical protein